MKSAILSLAVLTAPLADAMFALPQLVPVATLEKNATTYTVDQPRDANGWYVLARIHYLAFVQKAGELAAYPSPQNDQPPAVDQAAGMGKGAYLALRKEAERRAMEKLGITSKPDDLADNRKFQNEVEMIATDLKNSGWKPPVPAPEELARHVRESLAAFAKAQELEPNNALYQLGKASLLDQYALGKPELEKAGVKDLPAAVEVKERAAAYHLAFTLSKDKDAARPSLPLRGLSDLVSYEAGMAYLKLEPEGANAAGVKEHLAKLDKLPPGPITPIVFSMEEAATSLESLLDPGRTATFDLTGLGRADAWPWLKPTTSLLVWDPKHGGCIRDGRQLFGTYTWGIFWENGFRALAMLDDNHDGVLSGKELEGLAAWTDADGDGVSSLAEVVPLSKLRVRSIATHERGTDGVHPHHPEGMVLEDGSTRPLWDWVTKGIEP
ncbi:hypothetical protein [Luteolibacter sp. LG18]|uniref:hypothetical protein n=1 Tax=Luteolibacter sp. LG18 TaxID=2819286 RepID=UPI002B2A5165|nr:hypothetical protein llg_24460 [Luteolibacter sp. LG18]